MLIRSQDKTRITNFGVASSLFIDERGVDECGKPTKWHRYEILASNVMTSISIGQYFTEEKAIKVLDEICERYQSSLYCDHAFDMSANVQRPYIFVNNEVYQMPQDEEVIE